MLTKFFSHTHTHYFTKHLFSHNTNESVNYHKAKTKTNKKKSRKVINIGGKTESKRFKC